VITALSILLAVLAIGVLLLVLHVRARREWQLQAEEACREEHEHTISVVCDFLDGIAYAKNQDGDTRTAGAFRCASALLRKSIYLTPEAMQNETHAHEGDRVYQQTGYGT